MDGYEKHRKLVNRLIQRTRAGALDWKQAVSDNAFQVSFGGNGLRLVQEDDRNYSIQLLNGDGAVVETIRDTDLDFAGSNYEWFNWMRSLYEMAQRSAYGADKVLDEILRDLDEDDPRTF